MTAAFTLGVAVGAVIAGVAVHSRAEARVEAVRRQGESTGIDKGFAAGLAARPPMVRGLDAAYRSGVLRGRAHHPSTFAERN